MMVAWSRMAAVAGAGGVVCDKKCAHFEAELRGSSVGLNGEEERAGQILASYEARHRLYLSCLLPSSIWQLHMLSYSL